MLYSIFRTTGFELWPWEQHHGQIRCQGIGRSLVRWSRIGNAVGPGSSVLGGMIEYHAVWSGSTLSGECWSWHVWLALDLLIVHLGEIDSPTPWCRAVQWDSGGLAVYLGPLLGIWWAGVDLLLQRIYKGAISSRLWTIWGRQSTERFAKLHRLMGSECYRLSRICSGLPHIFKGNVFISLPRDELFIWPIWSEESQLF